MIENKTEEDLSKRLQKDGNDGCPRELEEDLQKESLQRWKTKKNYNSKRKDNKEWALRWGEEWRRDKENVEQKDS